jgi:PAS domain S-box-containing protein
MPEKDASIHPWLMERRYFSLIIVSVFVILAATAFTICSRHHTIATEQNLKEDRSDASLLSLVLGEHLKKIVGVMESYGNRPSLLQAVRDKNAEKAVVHLISLTKRNPGIDSVIITDRQGTLWANYPEHPEVLGKNYAYRDWYKDVSKEWKSNISDVYLRVVAEKDLAVGVYVPFFNETGEAIGVLLNAQRTVGLSDLIKQVSLDPGQDITVTDRKGQIIYSSRYVFEGEIARYPFYDAIKKAMAAKNKTFAVDDPDLGGRTRYISFAPVTNIGWTVSVERDKRSILLSESAYYVQVTVIAFLLFLSTILFLFYSRKQVMTQQVLEQLQAEKIIRKGEERYKSYIDVTMQVGWTTNDEGKIVEDNPSFSKYTGRGYEEIKGFGWIEDIHPDDRDRTGQIWKKAVAEKSFYETEYRLRRYDGVYRNFLARGMPLLAENGNVQEWVGSCIDITERQRAEEEVAQVAREWQTTFDATNDSIWILDKDQRVLRSNSAAERIFGRPMEEFIGKHCWEIVHGTNQPIPECPILRMKHSLRRETMDLQIGDAWLEVAVDPILSADGQYAGAVHIVSNVTERKRAEEALRESEGKFREMVETIPLAIYLTVGIDQKCEYLNPMFIKLFGYTLDIIPTVEQWWPLAYPDETYRRQISEEWTTKVERAIETQTPIEPMEVVVTCKDGSKKNILWGYITISEKNYAYGLDLTDRKRSEDALRLSEEKFAKAFQFSPDAFLLTSVPDGRITEVNAGAILLSGYSVEEMLGRTTTELGLWADPAARDAYMAEILREGRAANFETVFRVKSGAIITGLISGGIIQLRDEKCFLSVIRDISDRKLAEEEIHRQSKLLAAINSVFLETLTADSKEMVAMTCLKVAQELTGSKFGFLGEITPEGLYTTTALSDPGWEACRIPETQANVLIKDMVIRGIWGQVILKEQSLIVNDPVSCRDRVGIPEGHPPLTSFLGVPLEDQGKVIGMIAMANRESGYTADQQHDLEALCVAFVEAIRRKRAEQKIIQLNAELEQRVRDRTVQLEAVNKELEAFSYSVSHDLRAPLRSIDGFSQVLLEEYPGKPLDDTGKIYLERVRKATQKMGFLIDDMLKLSRVSRTEFNSEAVDLSGMVRAIVEVHQKNNPERVVDVTVQEGIMVQGDPYMMKIVLDNLMDNAWKFTGKEAHPRIEFGTTARDGKTVCFIRDNGAGFDMAYVNKLFGAFQRLHTTHDFPGTGIGLSTVQRIIHRHGGRVWAEGEVGKGATFYFTLPS